MSQSSRDVDSNNENLGPRLIKKTCSIGAHESGTTIIESQDIKDTK